MTLDELIKEGKAIFENQQEPYRSAGARTFGIIRSENYRKWSEKTKLFLRTSCSDKPSIDSFTSFFMNESNWVEASDFQKSIQTLEALKEMESFLQVKSSVENQLKELIKEGNNIYQANCSKSTISADIYIKWAEMTKDFLKNHSTNTSITANFNSTINTLYPNIFPSSLSKGIKLVETILENGAYKETTINDSVVIESKQIEKIFISHAEKDSEYIKLFVKLLNNIGIIDKDKIFCSSIIDYGIPNREKIYEYIKEEFNQNVFVIFFLSNNYYKSAACLNEMGATWIKSNEYQSILLPNFEFGDMRGAVDPSALSFKIDDDKRLNHFKEDLSKFFKLSIPGTSHWEDVRDEFLRDVKILINKDKKSLVEMSVEKVKKVEDKIEVYIRTLNLTNNPIEILEIDLELIDKNGKIFNRTLELNQDIFPNENRVDMQIVEVGSSEFNGNRVDLESSKIEVHI